MREALIKDIRMRDNTEHKITEKLIIEAYFYRYLMLQHNDKLQ